MELAGELVGHIEEQLLNPDPVNGRMWLGDSAQQEAGNPLWFQVYFTARAGADWNLRLHLTDLKALASGHCRRLPLWAPALTTEQNRATRKADLHKPALVRSGLGVIEVMGTFFVERLPWHVVIVGPPALTSDTLAAAIDPKSHVLMRDTPPGLVEIFSGDGDAAWEVATAALTPAGLLASCQAGLRSTKGRTWLRLWPEDDSEFHPPPSLPVVTAGEC